MKIRILCSIVICLVLFGCSSDNSELANFSAEKPNAPMMREMDALRLQKEKNPFLAYEHSISATIERTQLGVVYNKLIETCMNDEEHICTLMNSNLSSGDYGSGYLRLRVAPAGVPQYLSIVSEGGEISNQSVGVDDLEHAIVDSEKRLKMLYDYRDKLEKLETTIENDVDALIRVASELSTVQSNIEYAVGQNASLLQRVQMDIVNISLHAKHYDSFWRPINESLDSFGENLSEGISTALTVTAFTLPWIVVFILLFLAIRFFWKKKTPQAINNKAK